METYNPGAIATFFFTDLISASSVMITTITKTPKNVIDTRVIVFTKFHEMKFSRILKENN